MTPIEIREFMERYGLRPIKGRGQNFLLDQSVAERMSDEAGIVTGDKVLEIGPGLGMLTEVLLERGSKVLAVELDPGLTRAVRERLPQNTLELLEGDFLEFTSAELADRLGTKLEGEYKVVANLPYSITSDALRKLLTESPRPKSVTIMIQHEVAQRAVAQPPKSGLLSIVMSTYGKPKILLRVSPSSFWPSPKVESAVLHISLYSSEEVARRLNGIEPEKFLSVVRQAFSRRRKQLKNTLSRQYDKETLNQAFSSAEIEPRNRPERLAFEQWVKLVSALMQ